MKQWKKFLAMALSACMLANTPTMISVTDAADIIYDETKFSISDGYLYEYKGTDSVVQIPKGVTVYGYAFCNCESLEKIYLPLGSDYIEKIYEDHGDIVIEEDANVFDKTITLQVVKGSIQASYAYYHDYKYEYVEEPVDSSETPDGSEDIELGDVYHDGDINLNDAQLILKRALAIIDSFE